MRRLGNLTVNGAAMSGFLKLMMGYSLSEVRGTLITLSGIALVFIAAGAYLAARAKEI
jgi:hypothetical protein